MEAAGGTMICEEDGCVEWDDCARETEGCICILDDLADPDDDYDWWYHEEEREDERDSNRFWSYDD
jgi:hypothetical protein